MQAPRLIIIGGGPAGLTAAIYGARAGMAVTVLERMSAGGQMALTPDVENYPAWTRVEGFELASRMEAHARALGAEIIYTNATGIEVSENRARAVITDGGRLEAAAVIAAMGVERKKIGCEGEQEYAGRGVSYCAACDGRFFAGKTTAVVGGGDAALEDAAYLAGLGCDVRLIHRRDTFRGGRLLESRVRALPNVKLELQQTPLAIRGGKTVESLELRHMATGAVKSLPVSAVFAAVGVTPMTALLEGLVPLTASGHVEAGEDCRTPVEGLFAAGDIRQKPLYQIITAASDGAAAAQEAARYAQAAWSPK